VEIVGGVRKGNGHTAIMYKGKDLIIATGTPGSRWSGAIRCIQSQVDINTSDEVNTDSYTNGAKGWHRGAYWGPGHDYGLDFDRLDQLTRDDVIAQFQEPFDDWDSGVKIVKSHWFSYHIPQLREWFPEAKFLAFWMPDDFCFDWWHQVGGWNITYPHYTWYENDQRMRKQIAIENNFIQQHFDLQQNSLVELLHKLGLDNQLHKEKELCKRDTKFQDLAKNKSIDRVLNDTVQRIYTGVL